MGFQEKIQRDNRRSSRTDVPPEAEPTGLTTSPPSNHVQDAGAYAGYDDSVPQKTITVNGKTVDLSGLPEKTFNQVLVLKDAYEKHHRMADREEMERLLMEAFGKELDGVLP